MPLRLQRAQRRDRLGGVAGAGVDLGLELVALAALGQQRAGLADRPHGGLGVAEIRLDHGERRQRVGIGPGLADVARQERPGLAVAPFGRAPSRRAPCRLPAPEGPRRGPVRSRRARRRARPRSAPRGPSGSRRARAAPRPRSTASRRPGPPPTVAVALGLHGRLLEPPPGLGRRLDEREGLRERAPDGERPVDHEEKRRDGSEPQEASALARQAAREESDDGSRSPGGRPGAARRRPRASRSPSRRRTGSGPRRRPTSPAKETPGSARTTSSTFQPRGPRRTVQRVLRTRVP